MLALVDFVVIILVLISRSATTDNSKFSKSLSELVIDLSKDCENNYVTSVHMSYGTGSSDAKIILLRSISSLFRNCSLFITSPQYQNSCKDKCITVVVVELFNYNASNTFCLTINGGISLVSEDVPFVNVCADINRHYNKNNEYKHQMHTYLILPRQFFININFTNVSATIKMTVTAAKHLGSYGNCSSTELYCILDGQVFCIDKLLECDGNFNCGTRGLHDEYCSNLYVQENILLMIVYGTCLVAVMIFFLVQILRVCVPTVAEHFFIFKESEENQFVLTSQSLPPLKEVKGSEDENQREIRNEQFLQRKRASINPAFVQIY